MSIEYFLFTLYLILCLWIVPKFSFIRHAGLNFRETRLLLIFKIASGVAGAFYFGRITSSTDYLSFNEGGKIEYQTLISNPKLFFTDFTSGINDNGLGGLFSTKNSFWADLRFNLLHKFIAILDLLTKGNFYFNTVIFCTILFFGHIAFYRIYSEIYKGDKLKILFACFSLPSLLLYTCCIHKDGIIFLSLGIISYILHRILSSGSINSKYILVLFAGMATIFLFRNYVVIAILPAIAIALLCKFLPHKKRVVVLVAYAFFLGLFFLSGLSNSSFNLPSAVVQRQADFSLLEGATNISLNELHPTLQSFISNLPQAINHYIFRPYLWEFSQSSVLLTAIELFVYQLILLAFIFFRKKDATAVNNFNIFGLALLFNMTLIIGYTIPNIGAIVRYRSIFWIFLLCPVICNIDWKRLIRFNK